MPEVYAGDVGPHESNVTAEKDGGELVEGHCDYESDMDI